MVEITKSLHIVIIRSKVTIFTDLYVLKFIQGMINSQLLRSSARSVYSTAERQSCECLKPILAHYTLTLTVSIA